MTDLSNHAVRGYSLGECVGRGGSGAVYRAYQTGIEREVAIKVILPEYANQPEFIRRFEVEARLIAQLEHPHIVPLYDFWREPDGAYLVMRWLPRSLRSVVGKGRYWSVDAAVKLLEQIGGALIAAHRKGIIHRDIKPDNILLDSEGNAYLADFGIAKNLNATNNSSGNFRGTPAYVAPEQIKGEMLDQRTDIYLLGLVLYELLVGEKPYGDDASPATLLIKHLTDPLPALHSLRSDLPRNLNAVIQTATQKNPTERYADVGQLLAALHQAVDRTPAATIPGTEELTIREREIIELLAQGLGIPEIAERLVMSPSTVKWYLKQIYDKLDVHSRPQAIDRAKQLVQQWSGVSANPSADGKLRPNATERSVIEPITSIPIAVENPYKGLRPFLEADATHFFGRDKLIERLLARLAEHSVGAAAASTPQRFLAVVGASGSGKSSVVQAGLLPRLRAGALQGAEKWFIATMYPGAYPLEELESALLSVATNPPSDLMAQLRQESRGLLRAVKRILPRDEATELLLVIDQFEEIFTLVEDEAERAHFLDSLRLALSDPRSRLRVIITLRADFLDKPLQYVDFGEMLRQRIEFVLPLSPDELRRAILGPAEANGLRVESALVTTIVADVSEQPGALPLLQFALMELFERREGRKLTLNAYRASGGVAGALARRADELFESLNEQGQEAARQLFLRLIALGDVDNTRRRVSRSELATLVEQPGFLDAVIEAYNQYRLLTLDHDPATRIPTVEVAHEAVIRGWDRLRDWIEEAHDDLRAQRQLALSAEEWIASQYESSFLATGARLGRFEAMVKNGIIALNEVERGYFEASMMHRNVIIAAEEAQREHEAALTKQAIESAEVAEKNLLRSECLRLAAEANIMSDLSDMPEVAALLALRSLSIEYNADADLALLRAMDRGFCLAQPQGSSNRINSSVFSHDGLMLALSSGKYGTGWGAIICDSYSGKQVVRFDGFKNALNVLAFTHDNRFLIVGAQDKTLSLWDVNTHQRVQNASLSYIPNSPTGSLALSPDGSRFLIGIVADNSTPGVALWDIAKWQEVHRVMETNQQFGYEVAWASDDSLMATGGDIVRLWDTVDYKLVRQFERSVQLCGLAFSADNRSILAAYYDKTIVEWDCNSGEIRRIIALNYDHSIDAVSFSRDVQLAAICGWGGTVIVNLDSASPSIHRINSDLSSYASFSPDGKRILPSTINQNGRIYSIDNTTRIPANVGEYFGFRPALFPDGSNMLKTSRTDFTHTWLVDRSTQQTIAEFTDLPHPVMVVQTEHYTFINANNLSVQQFNPNTWERIQSFDQNMIGCAWLSVTSDEMLLAVNSITKEIILFDIAGGSEIGRISDTDVNTRLMQFLPESRLLLAGTQLFDLSGSAPILRYTVEVGEVITAACLSPDQTRVAGCGIDGMIYLWEPLTGSIITSFDSGHHDYIYNCGFSPDGKYLFIEGVDGSLPVYEAETGRLVRVLSLLSGINCVIAQFLPDQNRILAVSGDDIIWEFGLDYTEDVQRALAHLPFDLTEEEMNTYNLLDRRPLSELTWEKRI